MNQINYIVKQTKPIRCLKCDTKHAALKKKEEETELERMADTITDKQLQIQMKQSISELIPTQSSILKADFKQRIRRDLKKFIGDEQLTLRKFNHTEVANG